ETPRSALCRSPVIGAPRGSAIHRPTVPPAPGAAERLTASSAAPAVDPDRRAGPQQPRVVHALPSTPARPTARAVVRSGRRCLFPAQPPGARAQRTALRRLL